MIKAMRYVLGLAVLGCAPVLAGEWVQVGADSFAGGLFAGTEIDRSGRVSLASFRGVNLALDAAAASGPNTLSGRRSVTDGNADTEWRFDNEVEVLGKWIQIDLGGDRGVSQVRLLPGKTVAQRPLFFVKGYRLEVAREATPDDWVLVAQQAENIRPTVDTSVDSTWIETGVNGVPLPVLGRFVRLRLTREDPPNWVSIGEVEVFGEGFGAEGTFASAVFDAGQPVNLGRVWFAGETPPGTVLRVQFRTSADGETWPEWHRVPAWDVAEVGAGVALTEPEPAQFLQYRATMETRDPLRTPGLTEVWSPLANSSLLRRWPGRLRRSGRCWAQRRCSPTCSTWKSARTIWGLTECISACRAQCSRCGSTGWSCRPMGTRPGGTTRGCGWRWGPSTSWSGRGGSKWSLPPCCCGRRWRCARPWLWAIAPIGKTRGRPWKMRGPWWAKEWLAAPCRAPACPCGPIPSTRPRGQPKSRSTWPRCSTRRR